MKKKSNISRRDFMKATAVVSTAAMVSSGSRIFAAGTDKIRIGVIGCGGRGTGAAWNCIESAEGVELYTMGDIFKDRLDKSIKTLTEGEHKDANAYGGGRMKDEHFNVSPERCFTGFDAYKKVLETDIDLVILTCPPGFRPKHLRAAIEAGKHVFMEKPVAVDPVGVRSVIESSRMAEEKGLAIVAGTQRRHEVSYQAIMKRIHAGDIGEVIGGQCYWNGGGWNGPKEKPEDVSSMEWQIRNWFHFTWLGGDEIVEQHIHNIDIINWAFKSHPVKVYGMGGREVRGGMGNIFDHFAVEFEYANGARVLSMCRHMPGCSNRVAERIAGSKGAAQIEGGNKIITGQKPYKYEGEGRDPYIQEHTDLVASIRSGKVLNEGKRVAESTMSAIMGRMSAYTGRALDWDWAMKASKLDLSPAKYEFGDLDVRPIAVPGVTALV